MHDVIIAESFGHDPAIVPGHKSVIVDSFCGCAILRGANVFAPGVKGAPLSLKVQINDLIYEQVIYLLICRAATESRYLPTLKENVSAELPKIFLFPKAFSLAMELRPCLEMKFSNLKSAKE